MESNPYSMGVVAGWTNDELKNKEFPYIYDSDDMEWLKRMLFDALYYLKTKKSRSKNDILLALNDLNTIQDWFLNEQIKPVTKELLEHVKLFNPALIKNVEQGTHIEEAKQAFYEQLLGLEDSLQYISLYTGKPFAQLPCLLAADLFDDAEYYFTLVIFKAALALKRYWSIKQNLNNTLNPQNISIYSLTDLKTASSAVLEASIAYRLAERSLLLQSDHSKAAIEALVTNKLQRQGKKGAHVQHSKSRMRIKFIWEKFNELKAKQPKASIKSICAQLVNEVNAYSSKIGLKPFKPGSEIDNIEATMRREKKRRQSDKSE